MTLSAGDRLTNTDQCENLDAPITVVTNWQSSDAEKIAHIAEPYQARLYHSDLST
jgi:hypothetical protein